MIKILFVCHGNICRSPMAEFCFLDLAKKAGVEGRFYVASAGVSAEEIWNGVGNPVYPPAKQKLAEHGISCGNKRAQVVRKQDYDSYDLIIAMEDRHIRRMERIFGGDPEQKMKLLMSYAGLSRGVADPWYTDDFDAAWEDIEEGCGALLSHLLDARSQG